MSSSNPSFKEGSSPFAVLAGGRQQAPERLARGGGGGDGGCGGGKTLLRTDTKQLDHFQMQLSVNHLLFSFFLRAYLSLPLHISFDLWLSSLTKNVLSCMHKSAFQRKFQHSTSYILIDRAAKVDFWQASGCCCRFLFLKIQPGTNPWLSCLPWRP